MKPETEALPAESVKREQWGSRVAFILAAAGSAVGLGNIWRFPYVVGTSGGAAFVFVYLVIIVLFGYPMMVTEMTLGQKTHKNAIGSFTKLAPGTPWWITGALGVLAGFVILSFYSVVSGWSLAYFFKTIQGSLSQGVNFAEVFDAHIKNTGVTTMWHAVFMGLTFAVIAAGVVKGIERTVKILMPALFVLLIALVCRAVTLPGADEGIQFYLAPDFSKLTASSLLEAVGQAFFSLSLGMGCMITYGSYLGDHEEIAGNAAWVAGLDTAVALLAGFAIFPAVFALGFDPGQGPGLAFVTLPAVFAQMPGGVVFGAIFFLLLSVAALTSSISLLEVVVAWLVDEKGFDRKKSSLTMGILIFLLGIIAAISLDGESCKVCGLSFFDFLDKFQEKFLLPFGGLLTAVFAGYYYGSSRLIEDINRNRSAIVLGKTFGFLLKFVVPIGISMVMLTGWHKILTGQ